MTEEEKLIHSGENTKLEFNQVYDGTLLQSVPTKALSTSTLKTIVAFLNAEGGTLLLGVEDNGNIVGIEVDEFPNEDKYMLHFTSIVGDRIGKHYVEQIHSELKEIKGKKILRVDCSPSSTPVFLKEGNGEEFYVRNGPSSVLLTTSEVLEYSKKHFR